MAIDGVREAYLRLLDGIMQTAVAAGHTLVVLALGSSGMELERIDQYSDLDVWIIVEDGHKKEMLADLGWLDSAHPIEYSYMHGPNGYGVLFEGGITAEVDLFEMEELPTLAFSGARIAWKAEGVPDSIAVPKQTHRPLKRTIDELLGEALMNLYVGVGRFYRGEKLTAMRFVQVYAIDRILEMAELVEKEQSALRDIFAHDRRFERRFPGVASVLPKLVQGYEKTPESAREILGFLDSHFEVDGKMKRAIEGRLALGS